MTPVIGMIVPPAEGAVPPEAYGLYPHGIRFAARGLALGELTIKGYSAVIERVAELAKALAEEEGAHAISLMGTSLSFFRGGAFNEELVSVMQEATGLPATTMSNAIRDALRAVGARRVAVSTAYVDEVNQKLSAFLVDSGFEVVVLEGLGMVGVSEIRSVTEEQVADLAFQVARNAPRPIDSVLISCGGLPALNLAPRVEEKIGLPVVASATAGVWASVRLVGLSGQAAALGMLGRVSDKPVGNELAASISGKDSFSSAG